MERAYIHPAIVAKAEQQSPAGHSPRYYVHPGFPSVIFVETVISPGVYPYHNDAGSGASVRPTQWTWLYTTPAGEHYSAREEFREVENQGYPPHMLPAAK